MDDSKASGAPLTPSPSLSSPAPSSRPKHKRAPAGKGDCCRTCRLRKVGVTLQTCLNISTLWWLPSLTSQKVRCSGNPGTGEACTNCSRLDLQCGFKDATTTTDVLRKPSSQATCRRTAADEVLITRWHRADSAV